MSNIAVYLFLWNFENFKFFLPVHVFFLSKFSYVFRLFVNFSTKFHTIGNCQMFSQSITQFWKTKISTNPNWDSVLFLEEMCGTAAPVCAAQAQSFSRRRHRRLLRRRPPIRPLPQRRRRRIRHIRRQLIWRRWRNSRAWPRTGGILTRPASLFTPWTGGFLHI